ncbi:MAG: hypothetical protein QM775_03880, partial [Pirellulales bacterium]
MVPAHRRGLGGSSEFQLGLADGSQVRGTFEAVSADAIVVNAAPGGRRKVLTSQLLTVAPAAASEYFVEAATVWVDLIDGTQFLAVSYTTSTGKATISFGRDLTLEIPVASVHQWFKEQPEAIAKQWETVLKQTPKADLIVIREETAIDYLEGLFGDVTPEVVQFRARRRNQVLFGFYRVSLLTLA